MHLIPSRFICVARQHTSFPFAASAAAATASKFIFTWCDSILSICMRNKKQKWYTNESSGELEGMDGVFQSKFVMKFLLNYNRFEWNWNSRIIVNNWQAANVCRTLCLWWKMVRHRNRFYLFIYPFEFNANCICGWLPVSK